MPNKDQTVTFYRTCFCTDAGRKVLGNMLVEAKFFSKEHTPEEQAVSNFMKTVLSKCGTYNIENVDDYVEGLLNLKVKE